MVNSIAEDKNPIPVTEDALVVSAFNIILEALLFPPLITVSLKILQSSTYTWLLSPKKRVVIKREDLAYFSPRIEFKVIRQAKNLKIIFFRSIQAL